MPKTHIMLGSNIVGRISFETEHLHATGGPEFPRLHLTIELVLTAATHVGANSTITIYPTSCVSLPGELQLTHDRIVSRFRNDVGLFAASREKESTTQLQLEIPITLLDLAHIEEVRTENFHAALKFKPLLAFHGKTGGIKHFEVAQMEAMVFTVPQSRWLGLLEQLGYGRFEILEMRIGEILRTELTKSAQQIRKAKDYLTAGELTTAVVHCRIALEEIVGSKDLQVPDYSRFRTKVEAFVAGHLSSKLQPEQLKLVNDEFLGIWSATSKSPHPAVPDYFRRRDAVFLFRKVSALLEYVSRLLSE